MNTRATASLRCSAATASFLAIAALAAPPLRAEVRSLSVGIDVNCPPGLGECWGQGIREGVAALDGIAIVADEADGVTQTVEVRTQGGRMISWAALAEQLSSIQMGARLRSLEVTVDGWLERHEGVPALRLTSTEELLQLAALTSKAQWDRRKNKAFPITASEAAAFTRLLSSWSGTPQAVRIVGPLRPDEATPAMRLEVREFYWFGQKMPDLPSIRLGVRVSSPYGLAEPWAELRESLEKFPGIQGAALAADAQISMTEIGLRDSRVFDFKQLAAHLQGIGIGAELTGVEASVEGRLLMHGGQIRVKPSDSSTSLALAPLTRKVQWDHRERQEAAATSVERNGYSRLLAESRGRTVRARVSGPLIQTPDGKALIMEVREFELNPRSSPARLGKRFRDSTPPAPPGLMRAIAHGRGSILLHWGRSEDSGLAGYNLYRSSKPAGPFRKVNKHPIHSTEYTVHGAAASVADYFAVTVLDRAGNESARSPVADARAPAAPSQLTALGGDRRVHLHWQDNTEPDFDSYAIYRSEAPGGPYAEVYTGILSNRFTDEAVENGKRYYFVVTAVDVSSNLSPFSNEGAASPAATNEVAAARAATTPSGP